MTTNENMTIAQLMEDAQTLKQSKADYIQPAGEFKFLDNGALTNTTDATGLFAGTSMAPGFLTKFALDQAFEKLGKAYKRDGKSLNSLKSQHLEALAEVEPDLFATVMNRAIARMPEKATWTVRTFENTVRAVLSKDYLIIDNDEMLGTLQTILDQQQAVHRISTRSFLNADNMSVDILFKDIHTGKGDGNGGFTLGVRVMNGETGKWKGGVYPIVKRHSCDNSITTDNRELCYEFRHSGQNTAASKRVLIAEAIGRILPFAAELVQGLIEAEEQHLPRFNDIVEGMSIKYGWSESITHTVFAGSEAKQSVSGLVNGITYAAHKATSNPEQRVEMETAGGNILFDTKAAVREALGMFETRQAREERAAAKQAARAQRELATVEL